MGPPCSGKTTYANKEIAKGFSTVRVGRDYLRYMLQNRGFCNKSMELHIGIIQDELTKKFLDDDYDIILDNTHCKYEYIQQVIDRFGDRARIVVVVFNVPKWKLKLRNYIRCIKTRVWIPLRVIDTMHKNFIEAKKKVQKDISLTLIAE